MRKHVAIDPDDCVGCELCVELCPTMPGVFAMNDIIAMVVNEEACEACMQCVENCPTGAVLMTDVDDVTYSLRDITIETVDDTVLLDTVEETQPVAPVEPVTDIPETREE